MKERRVLEVNIHKCLFSLFIFISSLCNARLPKWTTRIPYSICCRQNSEKRSRSNTHTHSIAELKWEAILPEFHSISEHFVLLYDCVIWIDVLIKSAAYFFVVCSLVVGSHFLSVSLPLLFFCSLSTPSKLNWELSLTFQCSFVVAILLWFQ